MTSDGFEVAEEMAEVIAVDHWILVGGLMVHAHAIIAGVPNARATDDTDIVVEIVAGAEYGEAVQALEAVGFHFEASLDDKSPAHRFQRGDERVDLMAPDRAASVRLARRDVIQVPGSSSALKRTERFTTGRGIEIRLPDLTLAPCRSRGLPTNSPPMPGCGTFRMRWCCSPAPMSGASPHRPSPKGRTSIGYFGGSRRTPKLGRLRACLCDAGPFRGSGPSDLIGSLHSSCSSNESDERPERA